ncbi:hypothetical protein, partial [Salmonella sp. SAL4455]|uniref:hypothetical protein n=1 Tax=Salmonella sp. SAL4455 TaxID=3159910 RepID=UPI00397A6383
VIKRAWQAHLQPEAGCSRYPAFQAVVHHLQEYPECVFLILYTKAVSLAGLGEDAAKSEALRILNRIARLREAGSHSGCGFE